MRALGVGALVGVVLAAALAALTSASATVGSSNTVSARNGEIAFIRGANFYGEGILYAVRPDGTGLRRLLKSGWIRDAEWSPDGKQIAIADKCELKIMSSSGGRLRTILRPPEKSLGQYSDCFTGIGWSPDSRRLVVTRCDAQSCEFGGGPALYVVNATGRGLRQLTQRDCVSGRLWFCPGVGDGFPDWSPDGKKILFQRLDVNLPDPLHGNWANNARLYLVNPDGSGLEQLPPRQARSPEWSPDGSRIAFVRIVWTTLPPGALSTGSHVIMNADGSGEKTLWSGERESCGWGGLAWAPDGGRLAHTGPCPQGIYTMAPDGSDPVRLTSAKDRVVDWRPLPGG